MAKGTRNNQKYNSESVLYRLHKKNDKNKDI